MLKMENCLWLDKGRVTQDNMTRPARYSANTPSPADMTENIWQEGQKCSCITRETVHLIGSALCLFEVIVRLTHEHQDEPGGHDSCNRRHVHHVTVGHRLDWFGWSSSHWPPQDWTQDSDVTCSCTEHLGSCKVISRPRCQYTLPARHWFAPFS